MSLLLLVAKQRARRRRRQAGAAMFIVSMMVTVLASVGMFALAASATEVKTAGNERQSAQTHYLAEYGVLAFARETEQGKISSYISLMRANPDTGCLSLPIPSASYINGVESGLTKACYRLHASELSTIGQWGVNTAEAYGGVGSNMPSTAPGSLGPVKITPQFFVEVTDVGMRNAPGYSLGSCAFAVVTGTAFGVTQPVTSTGAIATSAEGMEMQRARLVAGPVCPPPQ